jgi:hypothetical protein
MSVSLPPPIDQKPRSRSKLGRRALILLLSALAIVGASFVALLVFAFRAVELSEQAGMRGRDFGVTTSDSGCLRAVASDLDAGWSGFFDQDEAEFLRECLKAASRTSSFCDGVPLPSDTEASNDWYAERSVEVGCPQDLPCTQLFGALQYHCLERRGGG